MKKIDIALGMYYLEVPEEELRILCGCPENSIKFIMQKGLTPKIDPDNSNIVSGPNAILLNDLSILNSHYLNFAEFPVLHHQFFQGAAYNGKNEKFTIIGMENRVKYQQEYIRCGFQGLTKLDELLEADLDEETANKFLAMGKFHRGGSDEFNILKPVYISGKTNIKGELYIERLSLNKFLFSFRDEKITVDLNLPSDAKGVGLPYKITQNSIKPNKFSVTTIGDGNGWNPEVPCLSSVVTAKGNKFLIDSGPGSLDLLNSLGISPSELSGVFLTHSHDDHFAGILSLLNAENKLRFFATPLVRSSIQKKFRSLLNFSLDDIKCFIDFIELKEDRWIDIGEMEVKANYSFHTVETNIFYFRVNNSNINYKTYGHITDILSKRDLDLMIKKDTTGIIKKDWAYKWFDKYFEKCDLKRIDAGGGPVHGDSHDFINDESEKIVLSHLDRDIDTSESPRFSKPTDYGYTDILIDTDHNYYLDHAKEILREIGFNSKNDILEKQVILKTPGEIIYHRGEQLSEIYLVLSGMVQGVDNREYKRKYIKGDFIYTFNKEKVSKKDYVSKNHSVLLKLDIKDFFNFVKKERVNKEFIYLRNCSLFSYGLSYKTLFDFSKKVKKIKHKKGQKIETDDNIIYIVQKGEVEISKSNKLITTLQPDHMSVLSFKTHNYPRRLEITEKALSNTVTLQFHRSEIKGFVALMWSIYEELNRVETIVETGIM